MSEKELALQMADQTLIVCQKTIDASLASIANLLADLYVGLWLMLWKPLPE